MDRSPENELEHIDYDRLGREETTPLADLFAESGLALEHVWNDRERIEHSNFNGT
jgi:hypothetical protein